MLPGGRRPSFPGNSYFYTNITRIIAYSLNQRVLSLYTAFLALEPNQGGEVCNACREESSDDGGDGGLPVDTDDETPAPEEAVLTAYPNPFTTSSTIEVALPEPVEAGAGAGETPFGTTPL